VRDHAARGADGVKLFAGSYQGGGKVAVLPLAIAKAAVAEAHRHAMPVFAHPQNLDGVEVAIDSGVDVLAHTVPESPPWMPELVARLKRANMALIPTLTLFDFEARESEGSDEDKPQCRSWASELLGSCSGRPQQVDDFSRAADYPRSRA
jgi:hypothetical protein